MNTTVINTMLKAGKPILEIASKLNNNEDVVALADMVKHDSNRVDEFIKVFLHRKKLSPKTKWDSLVILDRKHVVFEQITINNDGRPEYDDEAFLSYVIKRYVASVGIYTTNNQIAVNLDGSKFNPYTVSIYVMHHFVDEYVSFLYSEFNDVYPAPVLLQALAIVEEVDID